MSHLVSSAQGFVKGIKQHGLSICHAKQIVRTLQNTLEE